MAKKQAKKTPKKSTLGANSVPGVSPIVPSTTTDSTPHPGGRPSLYDKDKHPSQAFALTGKLGADIEQVAEILQVASSTIYNWMKDHPEFLEAINKGRELYDNIEVEGTLLKRALGYTVEEKTFEYHEVVGEEGKAKPEREKVLVKSITKHIPSSTGAMNTWLFNRMPDRWRYMGNIKGDNEAEQALNDLMGKREGLVVDLSQLSRDDAESLRTIIEKQSVGPKLVSSG